MKGYTSLEQSKKLAKILQLKSADMVLLHEEPYETSDSKFDGLHQALCVPYSQYDKSWRQKYRNISYFPCWSLAALLDIIPYPTLGKHANETWSCASWVEKVNPYFVEGCDSPINACYEIIIKLNELNLL